MSTDDLYPLIDRIRRQPRCAHYFTGAAPAAFRRAFSSHQLEEYLFIAAPQEEPGALALLRDGAPIEAASTSDEVIRCLFGGAVVVLNHVEQRWPEVARAAAVLSSHFDAPVNANVYIGAPHSRCFSAHVDPMDVVVVQTEGAKKWRLYEIDGVTEHALEAGDALYVPRGLRHEAIAGDSLSTHVTYGIHPLTAGDLIRALLDTGSVSEQSREAPFDPGPGPGASADSGDCRSLLRALDSSLSSDRFQRCLVRHRKSSLGRSLASPSRYLASLRAVEAIDGSTVLCRRPGLRAAVFEDGDFVELVFGDAAFRRPAAYRRALSFVCARASFQVSELPYLAGDDQRSLAQSLVRCGALELMEAGP